MYLRNLRRSDSAKPRTSSRRLRKASLSAADDRVVVALVERLDGGVEDAVDAVLDEHLAVLGLDVDVGRAAVDRAEDQRIHEAHDRALRGQHARVGDVGLVVGHELQAQRLAGLLEHQLAAAVALQRLLDALPRRDHRFHRAPEQELDLVHLERVLEAGERQHEATPLPSHGNAAEAHQQLQRRFRPELRVVGEGLEGIEGVPEAGRRTRGLLAHASES